MEYWKILEMYNDVTRRAAKEEGVWIVDLARDMPKDSTYFYDGIHFTNEGAEKVAELLGIPLLDVLTSRSGPSAP
jgi:hypothetical protein